MNITLNNINNIKFSGSRFSIVNRTSNPSHLDKNSLQLTTLPCDTLEVNQDFKISNKSQQLLSKFKKFDISSYNSLSIIDKMMLKKTSMDVVEAAEDNVNVGIKVKEYLDRIHGEDNYVFVSVGTSPAGIGRTLEFMGVETKYLPISGLKYYCEDETYKQFEPQFPKYKEFLDEQGLSREEIMSSDKKYIFYDYAMTGSSLSVFSRMIRENFGLDMENVAFGTINYDCYIATLKNTKLQKNVVAFVDKYMADEEIAQYCGVAHLPIWEINKIDECKNFESEKAKRFNFLVIDLLNRKKLLKDNPKNKNSL